jgi:hypothetical protein
VGVALFGSKPIQPDRFSAVLRHALADVIHDGQNVLRVGVALID